MVPASLTVGTQTRSATMIEAATEDARMTDGVMTSATIAEATSSEAAFAYATMHDASVLDQTMTEEKKQNYLSLAESFRNDGKHSDHSPTRR